MLRERADYVRKIVCNTDQLGRLLNRESSTLEFKRSFSLGSLTSYSKTMAAFANNRGGYIVFGINDAPREIVGIDRGRFENLPQQRITDVLNSMFSPSLEWECGCFSLAEVQSSASKDNGSDEKNSRCIGWIYTAKAERKPIIAQKAESKAKISNGDIFYRYRARSEKIKSAEMRSLIEEQVRRERERLLRILEVIRKEGTANLGIIDYSDGKFTTPYGVDVAIDRKLVVQVLKKAKYIKEGSFHETEGLPVIKVSGNIDLAEEVPVPDLDPNVSHPYIQKQLAEELGIRPWGVYALVWHFGMKGKKKFHVEITTSKNGAVHKFSPHALRFLKEQLEGLSEEKLAMIIRSYGRSRNSERKPA